MRRRPYCCYFIFTISLTLFGNVLVAEEENLYMVGIGDVLSIEVRGQDNFVNTITVNPDGTITFPFIGAVRVKDMTLEEISNNITNELSPDYIKYPVVVARLVEARSQKFYIYGEVRKPGSYRLDDKMTLVKAIAMAGGYGEFANTRLVKILRPYSSGTGYDEITINLDEIINNPTAKKDIFIRKEDIIVLMSK